MLPLHHYPGVISIHAPAGGATLPILKPGSNPGHFNPRSRGGSDTLVLIVSAAADYFNPRSRGGSDMGRVD